MSAIAPALSLLLRHAWFDVVWWSVPLFVVWFVYNGQTWVQEEIEAIENLEKLRYHAQGA